MNRHVSAASVPIEHKPLPADPTLKGSPAAGFVTLGTLGDAEFGLWEMTPGTSSDVEADEVFVVLSGRARIDFPAEQRSIEVGSGDIVRLTASEHTVWTVTETLRKVFLSR